jgi:hypothetical protein
MSRTSNRFKYLRDEAEKHLKNQTLLYLNVVALTGRKYRKSEFIKTRLSFSGTNSSADNLSLFDELKKKELKDLGLPGQIGAYIGRGKYESDLITHKIVNLRIDDEVTPARLIGDVIPLNIETPQTVYFVENWNKFVFRPSSTGWERPDGSVEINDVFGFDALEKYDDSFQDFVKLDKISYSYNSKLLLEKNV